MLVNRKWPIHRNKFRKTISTDSIQSGLSISQIKDHPRSLTARNSNKKLLSGFCTETEDRNPTIFSRGLRVKSQHTFHITDTPAPNSLCFQSVFYNFQNNISFQQRKTCFRKRFLFKSTSSFVDRRNIENIWSENTICENYQN